MKKTLLTILCAFVSLFGMAQNTKTYSEQLLVTINGETSEPQTTDVTVVDNGDGTINFELKNFILNAGEEVMYVGNICVANIAVKAGEDGLQYFAYDGSIQIQNGDLAGVDMWYGPLLGNIPLNLNGKMNDEKLFVTIDIDMQTVLGQIIHVELSACKVYTEQLLVTINGETSEPQTTDVTVVDNGDGTINFELKNFILNAGEEVMYVGNICVANIAVKAGEDGLQYFAYDGSIQIQNGDLAGVDMWYGPLLGNIPLNLNGKMNDEKLFVTIDIDMQTVIGQIIHVELGTDNFAKTGDLNGDGKIDIADAVSVLNIMAASDYSKSADVNADNKVDIADFVSILNIMAAQ